MRKALLCILGIVLIAFVLVMSNYEDVTQPPEEKKAFCPSPNEMEDAIFQYKDAKIISSFEPKLNSVYISPFAEIKMEYNDLQTLGYLTACYCGYKKGNGLHWVEIYSSKNHKKLAKYSESYGFKLEK